jgi:hypothetical protein
MLLTSWLSSLASDVRPRGDGRPRRRQPATRPRRPRLSLEQLEDRTLPSTFYAATAFDLIADIKAANQSGGSNTIVLTAPTTSPYVLTAVNNTTDGANGLPVIAAKDALTISGNNAMIEAEQPTFGGAPIYGSTFRLFDVANHGALTLQNLTLEGGLAFGSGTAAEGGAILNQGTLTLTAVTVQNNTAQGFNGANASNVNGNGKNGQDAAGGGIWSNGALTLQTGTVLKGNDAIGGNGGNAYYNFDSDYWGNGNPGTGGNGFGGGLCVASGTTTLHNASLLSNTVYEGGGGEAAYAWGRNGSGFGGGLHVAGGTVSLNSDAVEYNAAPIGGGLYVAGGTVSLTGDTVEYNTARGGEGGGGPGLGGGLYVAGGTVTLCTDTIEYNTAADYFGTLGQGGGLYIAAGATVSIDSVTQIIHNTASIDPNIDGPYTLQAC